MKTVLLWTVGIVVGIPIFAFILLFVVACILGKDFP
jgi:hypothetical protein